MLLTILCVLIAAPDTCALRPARPRAAPRFPAPRPPAPEWERPLLQLCSAGWVLSTPAAITSSRPLIQNVFGLSTVTFEDNLREPAAGFLALTSPLGLLEGVLCLSLAGAVALCPSDRARVGAALAGTCGATLAALALAFASGLEVINPAALAAFVAIVTSSGALGLRATSAVDEPLALYKADALELLPLVGERGSSVDELTSLFYRSSALVGTVVGLSFLASPVSPIALFDTPEAPVTHFCRQVAIPPQSLSPSWFPQPPPHPCPPSARQE